MSCLFFFHSLNAVAASKQTHTYLRRTPKSSRRSKLTSFCLLHCIQRVILTQDRCWITSICGLFFLQRKKKHKKISHIWHVFSDLNITGKIRVYHIFMKFSTTAGDFESYEKCENQHLVINWDDRRTQTILCLSNRYPLFCEPITKYYHIRCDKFHSDFVTLYSNFQWKTQMAIYKWQFHLNGFVYSNNLECFNAKSIWLFWPPCLRFIRHFMYVTLV